MDLIRKSGVMLWELISYILNCVNIFGGSCWERLKFGGFWLWGGSLVG